jgi:hypothetical protein
MHTEFYKSVSCGVKFYFIYLLRNLFNDFFQ